MEHGNDFVHSLSQEQRYDCLVSGYFKKCLKDHEKFQSFFDYLPMDIKACIIEFIGNELNILSVTDMKQRDIKQAKCEKDASAAKLFDY